ncbi:unnamed protein product, partial [Symbiodinium necroappetens]
TTQVFAPPKAKEGGTWSTAEERRRRLQALCKWSNLLRLAPKLFSERTLASLPDTGDQAVAEHLDLLFSRKSTNTLLLRVQPLMRFVLWARRACPDESTSEQLVWVHCRWLQTTAAPSSIDIFVSSLHFVRGTLGLGVPIADLLSPRIRGLAHTHLRTKEPVSQAPPLSAAQVKWLEYLSGSASDDYERLVAATLCFMVFARARRSDLARATHVQFDLTSDGSDGFVECKVKNPKQVKAASRRNLFLPLTAVYRGLGSASWGALFFAARARLGLQNEGALDHPLIPALSSTGNWLPDCLSSAALTTWLRALLSRAPDADYGLIQQVRSHSCKATALVTLLGHHSQGRNMASLGGSGGSGRWQDTSSVSDSVSSDSGDEDEQQVAAAPHFLENLLSFGNYAERSVTVTGQGMLTPLRAAKEGRFLEVADVLKTAITQGNAQQQKRNNIISNIPMIGSVLERKASTGRASPARSTPESVSSRRSEVSSLAVVSDCLKGCCCCCQQKLTMTVGVGKAT